MPHGVLVEDGIIILGAINVTERLSWAVNRVTIQGEDRAYSLLRLFTVNMPTIYGEGEEATFCRLQIEVFKATFDHSIFALSHVNTRRTLDFSSLFAPTFGGVRFESNIERIPYRVIKQVAPLPRSPDGLGMVVELAVGLATKEVFTQKSHNRTFFFVILPYKSSETGEIICIYIACVNS
jgi:hypothetical protein